MDNITTELASEYRLVEAQVREKYKEVFDQMEEELREKWSVVWTETGFDVSKVRVRVEPRIRVSLADEDVEAQSEEVL